MQNETLTPLDGPTRPDALIHPWLVARNFVAVSIGSSVEHLAILFGNVYARRVLGAAAVGQVAWTASIVSYLALLVSPGIQTVARREVARHPDRAGRYLALLTLLQLALATVAFALAVAFGVVVPAAHDVRLLLALQALSFFVLALDTTWLVQARERMVALSVANVIANVGQVILLVLLVHEPADAVRWVVLAYPFRLAVYVFILQYALRHRLLELPFEWPNARSVRALLSAALPLGLSQLAVLSYYNSDVVVLGFVRPDEAVGVYSTAYSLMLVPLLLGRALSSAFFPALSRGMGDAGSARLVGGQYLRALILIGFPIAALGWGVGRHATVLLFGEGFAESGPLFEWLSLNIALIFINMGLVEPLLAWDAQGLALRCTLAGAAVNVSLNLILIPTFGAWGAVFATLVAELAVLAVAFTVRRRLHPPAASRTFVATALLAILVAIVARLLALTGFWILGALAGVAIYTAGVLLMERQQVTEIKTRILERRRGAG